MRVLMAPNLLAAFRDMAIIKIETKNTRQRSTAHGPDNRRLYRRQALAACG